MKKRIPAIILMFSLFLTGAFAANTYQKSIEVEYGISLSINGQTPTLTDADGNIVKPFVYQGTTYVPIRAVGENLGADVSYNQEQNLAEINFNKYDEQYLHFLALACNASTTIQGFNMSYLAMWLSHTTLQGRFYSSVSNVVSVPHDYMLSSISSDNPHYSKAREVDTILSEMLADFSALEDAYYNSNKSTFDRLYDEIQDSANEISNYVTNSLYLTYSF